MKESDQLTTSFFTPFGMYCYVTMPFGLRNTGAMYQRCMLHVFGKHVGSTVEAYVDDIVIKSKRRGDLIQDLEIAFSCLRTNQIKLNPEKCVFGVPRGMLLGYIVSQRGIKASFPRLRFSPGGFRRGVGRLPASPDLGSVGTMDDVFRRVSHGDGSWGRPAVHLAPGRPYVAEYEALVNGLKIAIELGVRRLDIRGDS